jgi:threonine dehydrogenase-like Zn-dependent dehydrogenase
VSSMLMLVQSRRRKGYLTSRLFLSDIFPTAYLAAEHCDITPEKTVAICGCGPVGVLAVKSCFLLGAKRGISIDPVPERLALARQAGAETIDFAAQSVQETIMEKTHGLVPDAVIEAVGMESHGADTLAQRSAPRLWQPQSAWNAPSH